MPYIPTTKRDELDKAVEYLAYKIKREANRKGDNQEGNLNYCITKLLMKAYGNSETTRYSKINSAIGLLECVKLELYRKVAAPYEDVKEEENGPVDS